MVVSTLGFIPLFSNSSGGAVDLRMPHEALGHIIWHRSQILVSVAKSLQTFLSVTQTSFYSGCPIRPFAVLNKFIGEFPSVNMMLVRPRPCNSLCKHVCEYKWSYSLITQCERMRDIVIKHWHDRIFCIHPCYASVSNSLCLHFRACLCNRLYCLPANGVHLASELLILT